MSRRKCCDTVASATDKCLVRAAKKNFPTLRWACAGPRPELVERSKPLGIFLATARIKSVQKLEYQFVSWYFLCWILAYCSMLGGCSTHAHALRQPRELFYENQLETAYAKLDKLSGKRRGDATVIELDLAVVDLLRGDAKNCERRLRAVRDQWDHFEQVSATETIASMLTDDQRRAYHGEDYEKMLVRVFLALASLMQDGTDAESYTLQMLSKHDQLQHRAASRWGLPGRDAYRPPPIGFYLRGVLREATHVNYDDALRAYQSTAELLPEPSFLQEDIQRVTHGVHSQPGNGVLYLFTLIGRGPQKIEVAEEATSDALLIADRIVSAVGKYSVPPTLAPIKVPRITSPAKPFDCLQVTLNGQVAGFTQPLTDVHLLATQTFDAKVPEIMARAVARRVIKKSALYVAKDQLNASAPLASLAMDAAGVAWEATEAADTRCWGLLPREIQILRVELPAGVHEIQMSPTISGRSSKTGQSSRVQIANGRNTYLLSYWPNLSPIGSTQVSHSGPK